MQVGEWLARRALDVDARTGLLGTADAILSSGAARQGRAAAGSAAAVREAAASLGKLAQSGAAGCCHARCMHTSVNLPQGLAPNMPPPWPLFPAAPPYCSHAALP